MQGRDIAFSVNGVESPAAKGPARYPRADRLDEQGPPVRFPQPRIRRLDEPPVSDYTGLGHRFLCRYTELANWSRVIVIGREGRLTGVPAGSTTTVPPRLSNRVKLRERSERRNFEGGGQRASDVTPYPAPDLRPVETDEEAPGIGNRRTLTPCCPGSCDASQHPICRRSRR